MGTTEDRAIEIFARRIRKSKKARRRAEESLSSIQFYLNLEDTKLKTSMYPEIASAVKAYEAHIKFLSEALARASKIP